MAAIEAEIATLAVYSLRSDTGAVGYRSERHESEFHEEWIQIDFDSPRRIDEIVIVPAIRRDARSGFQADGFPKHFRVFAGSRGNFSGQLIAEFADEEDCQPKVGPLVIPCGGVMASWIRIEAIRLSRRDFDGWFVFQLSEVMAFSGYKNIALHQKVTSRTNSRADFSWDQQFVVDGFVPYIMDAAGGEKSIAFLCGAAASGLPALAVDLGAPARVSSLQLHAVETSDYIPQPYGIDFSIPRRMRLEGANEPDFADANILLDLHLESRYEMSPLMTWSFPEATYRYFRLVILGPSNDPMPPPIGPRFGFAEIELLGDGGNILYGKKIEPVNTVLFGRSADLLTDGRNVYGNILPIREWMRQLARRQELEAEAPAIQAELRRRYAKQAINFRYLVGFSVLLALVSIISFVLSRMYRLRQIRSIKQRIAADLHDELGANLHTIGLLSDLAEDAKKDSDRLAVYHQRIRNVTERSGIAVRNCTNMYGSTLLYESLIDDMQRTAQRVIPHLEHDFLVEGEEHIHSHSPQTCFDLLLFYKECLVNISRHSGASQFSSRLKVTPLGINLTVSDNGRGLPAQGNDGIPSSLQRRAKLLGARLVCATSSAGGAVITLRLKASKRRWFLNIKFQ